MVIVDHFVDSHDNAWFTVATPEYDISENISAQPLLSIDPTEIELYRYLDTTPKVVTPCYDIQENIQSMIMDYFEVECYPGALELVETSLIAHRKPTTMIIQTMMNLLLKKRENITNSNTTRRQYKIDWMLIEEIHTLLQKMIQLFGSDGFDYLWDSFDHANPRQESFGDDLTYGNDHQEGGESDSDYADTLDGLGAFDDFWDFISKCFKSDMPLLQAKSYLYVLDILNTLLEQDFQSKRGCRGNIKKTKLLNTIRKNIVGGWDRFDKYLIILLGPFAHDHIPLPPMVHIEQKHQAGRLFNLMIAMSRYDITFSRTDLADQTFRNAMQSSINTLPNLVQYIKFDSFILQVLDAGFIDTNWSNVPQSYHYLKKTIITTTTPTTTTTTRIKTVDNPSKWLDKWIHAYTKLYPRRFEWSKIYLHVWMMKQYYHSILKVSSLRYHTKKAGPLIIRGCHDLDQDALAALLEDHLEKIQWINQVHLWMNQCQIDQYQWQQKITWLLDMFIF